MIKTSNSCPQPNWDVFCITSMWVCACMKDVHVRVFILLLCMLHLTLSVTWWLNLNIITRGILCYVHVPPMYTMVVSTCIHVHVYVALTWLVDDNDRGHRLGSDRQSIELERRGFSPSSPSPLSADTFSFPLSFSGSPPSVCASACTQYTLQYYTHTQCEPTNNVLNDL